MSHVDPPNTRRDTTPSLWRPGFTLIEVLVVVAIIALLIAILLPSLAVAREQSRRALCATRLHNIGTAVNAYANMNKGRIIECTYTRGMNRYSQAAINLRIAPLSGDVSAYVPQDFVDWHKAAKSVLLDKTAWECPNREGQFIYEGPVDQAAVMASFGYRVSTEGASGWNHFSLGYQYFGGIAWWDNPAGRFKSCSPTRIDDKPVWVLAADSNIKVDGIWGGGREAAWGKIPPHPASNGKPAGGNVLTLDAAVNWVPYKKMLNLCTWDPDRECYWYQQDLGALAKSIAGRNRDLISAK